MSDRQREIEAICLGCMRLPISDQLELLWNPLARENDLLESDQAARFQVDVGWGDEIPWFAGIAYTVRRKARRTRVWERRKGGRALACNELRYPSASWISVIGGEMKTFDLHVDESLPEALDLLERTSANREQRVGAILTVGRKFSEQCFHVLSDLARADDSVVRYTALGTMAWQKDYLKALETAEQIAKRDDDPLIRSFGEWLAKDWKAISRQLQA